MLVQMDVQVVDHHVPHEAQSIFASRPSAPISAPEAASVPRVATAARSTWMVRIGSGARWGAEVSALTSSHRLEAASTVAVACLLYLWTLAVFVGAW